jgi:hypothetical protein
MITSDLIKSLTYEEFESMVDGIADGVIELTSKYTDSELDELIFLTTIDDDTFSKYFDNLKDLTISFNTNMNRLTHKRNLRGEVSALSIYYKQKADDDKFSAMITFKLPSTRMIPYITLKMHCAHELAHTILRHSVSGLSDRAKEKEAHMIETIVIPNAELYAIACVSAQIIATAVYHNPSLHNLNPGIPDISTETMDRYKTLYANRRASLKKLGLFKDYFNDKDEDESK